MKSHLIWEVLVTELPLRSVIFIDSARTESESFSCLLHSVRCMRSQVRRCTNMCTKFEHCRFCIINQMSWNIDRIDNKSIVYSYCHLVLNVRIMLQYLQVVNL